MFFFTGGITNPFIFLIIIPAVFSSQYLNIKTSIFLVGFTIISLLFLTFLYEGITASRNSSLSYSKLLSLQYSTGDIHWFNFLVYFGAMFGKENRIREEAYDKIQEIMAKENELISLGGQAAAAAHSLGTPLSTILLTTKELQKEYGNNKKIKNDLDLY